MVSWYRIVLMVDPDHKLIFLILSHRTLLSWSIWIMKILSDTIPYVITACLLSHESTMHYNKHNITQM